MGVIWDGGVNAEQWFFKALTSCIASSLTLSWSGGSHPLDTYLDYPVYNLKLQLRPVPHCPSIPQLTLTSLNVGSHINTPPCHWITSPVHAIHPNLFLPTDQSIISHSRTPEIRRTRDPYAHWSSSAGHRGWEDHGKWTNTLSPKV